MITKIQRAMLVVVLALSAGACSSTHLRAYEGWGLQNHPTVRPDRRRTVRTGHLLEAEDALMLAVEHFSPGNILVVDDERCQLVWVEMPNAAPENTPTTVENPRAYLRRWACTWQIVEEEKAISGRVTLQSREPGKIRARIDLQFPSRRFRKSGSFSLSAPDSWLQGGTLASEEKQ